MEKAIPEKNERPRLNTGEDGVHIFMMADETIRGAVINGTRMVNQMRWNHRLGILETLMLGHAYLGAALMAVSLKDRDRLRLQIECSGPVKGLTVEANKAIDVRGFLKKTPIPIEKPLEDFDLAPFFGAGFISVTRMLENAKTPFTGQVMLKHGNIAMDLAHYYLASEQIHTAFNLSVKFDKKGRVIGAGGLYLQAMPQADDAVMLQIEDRVPALPSISTALSEGISPEALITTHFSDFSPHMLETRPVRFDCHCNRDQIRSLLTLLPMDELIDIQKNGPFPMEIQCHHCNTVYSFNPEQINRIVANRFPDN